MLRCAFLASLLVTTAFVPSASADDSQLEVLALVGRLVSIKELPNPCAGKNAECISLDGLYEAKYEVREVLSGTSGGPEISFRIADHYGFPHFADYSNALLFVTITFDGNFLQKYQGYPVHRTAGGSWATCGDPYNEFSGDSAQGLRTIEFAEDLGIVGDFSEEGIKERFPDAKYLEVSNGRIRCRRGIPVADLYERVRTGVMTARGIRMPSLAR